MLHKRITHQSMYCIVCITIVLSQSQEIPGACSKVWSNTVLGSQEWLTKDANVVGTCWPFSIWTRQKRPLPFPPASSNTKWSWSPFMVLQDLQSPTHRRNPARMWDYLNHNDSGRSRHHVHILYIYIYITWPNYSVSQPPCCQKRIINKMVGSQPINQRNWVHENAQNLRQTQARK